MGTIRVVVSAIIRHGDRILVWEDHNPETGEIVSVPLAGGLEFGETGKQAIARELHEEIHATVLRTDYLGTLEDIFDWAGQRRHELHLVYEVELADRSIYEADEVPVLEPDGTAYLARWRPLSEFRGSNRLVPEGRSSLSKARGVERGELVEAIERIHQRYPIRQSILREHGRADPDFPRSILNLCLQRAWPSMAEARSGASRSMRRGPGQRRGEVAQPLTQDTGWRRIVFIRSGFVRPGALR